MKLKKIVSLLISATMAFSAFAAVANAETKGAATVSVVGQFDEYAAAFGTTLAAGEGLFLIQVDMTGLGEWSLKKTTIPVTAFNGQMITGFELMLAGDATFLALDTENGALPVSGGTLKDGGLNFDYLTTVAANCYPKASTTVSDLSIPAAIIAYVKAPLGTQLEATSARYQVSTATSSAFSAASQVWYDFDVTSIDALGEAFTPPQPPVDDAELTMTVSEAKKYDNGYVWPVAVTMDGDALGLLTAVFTRDDDVAQTNRTTIGAGFGGEGTLEFAVGLKTASVMKSLELTVEDASGDTVTKTGTVPAAN